LDNRNEHLKQIAVAIVAEAQPCRPNDVVRRLRGEFGASHAEANRTLLELIRDGYLRRTFFGELVLPDWTGGSNGGGYPAGLKVVGVLLLLVIVAFMAWVFFHLFTGQPSGLSGA
jgi:hypothetical protein